MLGLGSSIVTKGFIEAGSAPLLLNIYSGASAAYSLRLLDTTYTGSAIRVRRASDNAEQDIGFDVNNELDTAALATFCAGTDGFVKTWYDQSGNANDATQTTTSAQPKIYDRATGVVTENGKPAVEFDGTDDVMTATPTLTNAVTIFTVYRQNDASYILDGNDTTRLAFGNVLNTSSLQLYVSAGLVFTGDQNHGAQNLAYMLADTTNSEIALNGATASTGSVGGTAVSTGKIFIGSRTNLLGNIDGKFQELIYWNNDQSSSRSGIETNINDFYSIYE